jgi:trehalose 6-phosphate synthase
MHARVGAMSISAPFDMRSMTQAVFVQVASPSRERVQQYQVLRDEVEGIVGRINGNHATLGQPAVQPGSRR